jgi:hypothetical protein
MDPQDKMLGCKGCRAFISKATGQLQPEESPIEQIAEAKYETEFAELDEDFRLTRRKQCNNLPESAYRDDLSRLLAYYSQHVEYLTAPKDKKDLQKILDVFDHDHETIWRSLHEKYGTAPLEVTVRTEETQKATVYYIVSVRHLEEQVNFKSRVRFSEVHLLNASLKNKVKEALRSSTWDGGYDVAFDVTEQEVGIIQHEVLRTLPHKSIKSTPLFQWADPDFTEVRRAGLENYFQRMLFNGILGKDAEVKEFFGLLSIQTV